jgi:hypothetical protein
MIRELMPGADEYRRTLTTDKPSACQGVLPRL